jgi:cell division topological specificity factor
MSLFSFPFGARKAKAGQTAHTAKERLQILLAHERGDAANSDVLPQLQREILDVIRRHLRIDSDAVDIRMERGDERSSLEINIDLPSSRVLPTSARR